jgi:hypothetical protein
MGNGFTKDGYMLGLSGLAARDCTEVLRTNGYFKSAESAHEELQHDIDAATRIVKPEAGVGSLKSASPGQKILVLAFRGSNSPCLQHSNASRKPPAEVTS